MSNLVNDRIRVVYRSFDITLKSFSEALDISEGTLKSMFNRGTNPSFDILEKIANAYENISMDWLITGKGDMYKTNTAGRDNNVVEGDNKGVVGSGNTTGSIGGNHVSIGDSSNIKKIMNEEGVSIEFAQSVDSLQQTNAHLEIRIKDLETINASQSKTIETMQLLIDTLTKK